MPPPTARPALDPFLAAKLDMLAGLTWDDMDDPAAAARKAAFDEDPGPWTCPDVDVADELVRGPHGDVPVRVYRTRGVVRRRLLWVHGGGFGSGGLDMRESHVVSAELAARACAQVVSVGYRLARDGVRYPVPLDDVHAAWTWLRDRAGPAGPPASVGGASAGAALALSAALRERDRGGRPPHRVLLAYPFAHFPVPATADDLAPGLLGLPPVLRVRAEDVEQMVRGYVGRTTDLPRLALPGSAALHGLPPTWVLLSELDDLRSSGELLARQILGSGGTVQLRVAPGMPHGHLDRTPALPEVDRSLAWMAEALTGP